MTGQQQTAAFAAIMRLLLRRRMAELPAANQPAPRPQWFKQLEANVNVPDNFRHNLL